MKTLLLLFFLAVLSPVHAGGAPRQRGGAPGVRSSTAAASAPEAALEAAVRRDENAVRRARYRLKRLSEQKAAPPETAAASVRLEETKRSLLNSRARLAEAVRTGSVAPGYLRLKHAVRDDLNAIRRARRALSKARTRSDLKAAARAEAAMREAKVSLKRNRGEMRRILAGGLQGGPGNGTD